MGSFGVAGIIIKRKNFSESDRILTVMTRNLGKIKVIAKGVRKITSRRAPTIDLLCLSQLQIYEGKTFYTLSESLSEKGIQEVKRIQREAVQKIHQVLSESKFQGDIPYFTINLSETLTVSKSDKEGL